MWAIAQQMLSRSPNATGNSNHTHPERPQSSSSEVELTSTKAGHGQGITKTMAWEMIMDAQQDGWSNVSEQESWSQRNLGQVKVASVRGKAFDK